VPELRRFEVGAAELAAGSPPDAWRGIAGSIERLLLGEWETRSCDEVCRRCEAAYATSPTAAGAAPAQADLGRAGAVLNVLRDTTRQGDAWHGHAAACDRSTSVLIAALNAVLRLHRGCVRALLAPIASATAAPSGAGGGSAGNGGGGSAGSSGCFAVGGGGGTRARLSRVISRIGRHPLLQGGATEDQLPLAPSRAEIVAMAVEAAKLAGFCSGAKAEGEAAEELGTAVVAASESVAAASQVCVDVVAAFGGAFERLGEELSAVLAEVHFAGECRQVLKDVSFGPRALREAAASPPRGVLAGACEAASNFLDEALPGDAPALCRGLACDAVGRLVARLWVRAFRRAPPRLSSCPTLPAAIAADEAALQLLAERWGAGVRWKDLASDPVHPLREVREMLAGQSTELVAIGAGRLEVALGAEHGALLANAVRLCFR